MSNNTNCFKCGEPIKFENGVVNKWGKPQQLNLDGSEHWRTCTARLAQKGQQISQKVMQPTHAQQMVRDSAQMASKNLQERSDTYVPEGYIQNIPTPQEPPTPLVKLDDVMTALNAIQMQLTEIREGQEKLWERVDFIYQAEREAGSTGG